MSVFNIRLPILAAVLAAFTLGCASPVAAHVTSISLYDGPAPGSEGWSQKRIVVQRGEQWRVYNTSQPVYQLHLPRPERASGAAVVMLPGGGLRTLSVGSDLNDEIDALVARGVAVIVLEYRTVQLSPEDVERDSAPRSLYAPPLTFPSVEIVNGNANPSPDDPELTEVLRLATMDAQAALRIVHENAEEWNIDPDRIGLMGTSAGGGVGFAALVADAPAEEKPDFLISIYGPSLVDLFPPAEGAPPLFMATEADHGPVTDGLIAAFSIWKAARENAELHIYEVPNFSMTVGLWGPRMFDWMEERGILPAADKASAQAIRTT